MMIKKVCLLILGLAWLSAHAQDPYSSYWTVSWNKKVILLSHASDETANTRTIKRSDLKKNYQLELTYKEGDPKMDKEWKRSIMVFDENDKELLRKDSTWYIKIKADELKKLFGDKKRLNIYTVATPVDPDLAARVRVRRVHLCSLIIK